MANPDKVRAALAKLDPSNDNHWTTEGLPRIDAVKLLTDDQTVSRDDITSADASFTRATAAKPAQAAQPVASTVTPESVVVAAPAGAAPDSAAVQGAPDGQVQPQATESAQAAPAASRADQLEAELHAAQDELAELERQAVQAQSAVEQGRRRVDRLVDELEQERPPATAQETVQDYLAAQQAILKERAERQDALKASGIDFKALLNTSAAIDAARKRK